MDVLVFAKTPIFFDQHSLQRRPPMSPTRPIEVPVPGRGLIHSILTGAFAAVVFEWMSSSRPGDSSVGKVGFILLCCLAAF